MRPAVLVLMAVLAFGVTACGRAKPLERPGRGYNCVGFSDDLKTLEIGDELPRVIQVLGMPAKAYRASGMVGRSHDVLEYKVGDSACAKVVLRSKKGMLPVVFDAKGQYVGYGEDVLFGYGRGMFTRTQALQIDPVVLKP